MASKRFTPEQIISKLREAEVLLPQGEKMTAELTTAPPDPADLWRSRKSGMRCRRHSRRCAHPS